MPKDRELGILCLIQGLIAVSHKRGWSVNSSAKQAGGDRNNRLLRKLLKKWFVWDRNRHDCLCFLLYEIGTGTEVMPNAAIGADTFLGIGANINTANGENVGDFDELPLDAIGRERYKFSGYRDGCDSGVKKWRQRYAGSRRGCDSKYPRH